MAAASVPAGAAPPGLSTIGQIAITVTDVDRAVRFYRDTLGIKFLFLVSHMAFFDCDGVRLMISASEKPNETYNSVIYFKVPDIQQAFRTLTARGAVSERAPHLIAPMPDHDLWMAFFRDPDRNLLALMSEVPR
jgi:methylmalonyl-CoA/ethylmalonyl-CoA epimerase